tara:strand:- start:4840 stop:5262 length:423 start_codon:yes stop_codon:yes gene_type:complete
MIKYILKCHNDHEFESWFSNSQEYEKLSQKNFLECIYCSSKKITKSIMAPMVSSSKNEEEQSETLKNNFQNEKNKLLKLRNYIENNFEFVEKDFSKRVREVYYDKKNKKAIYGSTTQEEKDELAEEGIDLLTIPWINKDN